MYVPYGPPVYRTAPTAHFRPLWAVDYAEALNMMKQAVQGERNDELFYSDLIEMAPTKEQKDIIASIREDERGHNRMFRAMYRELTGQEIPPSATAESYEKPKSYLTGIEKALFGELAAVERYRKMSSGLPAGVYRDTVQGILQDELKHAAKYNYLFTLNKTAGSRSYSREEGKRSLAR
ncbi:ferritin family protein [Gorillibacterium sp. sgz500922]|uniref:ferritin family protein n=1 Tax=Gorillibacterium sp. sgz500922 TaxID=3446694 RepID=UPI003F668C24